MILEGHTRTISGAHGFSFRYREKSWSFHEKGNQNPGLVEILKIFFLTLSGGYGCNDLRPRRCGTPPPGVITSDKVIRHNHKAQGRFGGTGTVPSVNGYHLLKT